MASNGSGFAVVRKQFLDFVVNFFGSVRSGTGSDKLHVALSVNEDSMGDSPHAVFAAHLAVFGGDHDRMFQFVVFKKARQRFAFLLWGDLTAGAGSSFFHVIPFEVVILGHADDLKTLVAEFFAPLAKVRKGRDARPTPHGPEVE